MVRQAFSARRFVVACTFALVASSMLSACTVVSIGQDKERRAKLGGNFDAAGYVSSRWADKIVPLLDKEAKTVDQVRPALDGSVAALSNLGARPNSDGSSWVIAIKGEGVVAAIDRTSRVGVVDVAVTGARGPMTFHVLTGPVAVSTALRDSLPFIDFNDFADQVSFAGVNKALNTKALDGVSGAVRRLAVGDRVRFEGVVSVAPATGAGDMMPLSLVVEKGGSS